METDVQYCNSIQYERFESIKDPFLKIDSKGMIYLSLL